MINSRSQFLKEIIDYDMLIKFIENLIHKKIEKLLNVQIFFDEQNEKIIVVEAIINKEKVHVDCVIDINLEMEE